MIEFLIQAVENIFSRSSKETPKNIFKTWKKVRGEDLVIFAAQQMILLNTRGDKFLVQ